MTEHRFQVDLRGILDLLAHHLYSGPQVFVRELLQNGVDALAARLGVQQEFEGEVLLEITTPEAGSQPAPPASSAASTTTPAPSTKTVEMSRRLLKMKWRLSARFTESGNQIPGETAVKKIPLEWDC